ncbi:MAG: hypothetical protein IKN11_07495 [Bacteroidales bacterium]|nr:hypothetical protein [Bacteroidales bacterium]
MGGKSGSGGAIVSCGVSGWPTFTEMPATLRACLGAGVASRGASARVSALSEGCDASGSAGDGRDGSG